jgi:hypothetical protein
MPDEFTAWLGVVANLYLQVLLLLEHAGCRQAIDSRS